MKKNESSTGKKKKAAIAFIVLFLILGTVWAFSGGGVDPQVEKVKQMQAEAFKEGLTPEQRHQSFEAMHQEMQNLSPEQRHQVHEGMRENFERRMDERIKTYFALPKAQRVAYMDKQIKEWEDRRKEMESRRNQGQGQGRNRNGQGGGPGGPPGAGQGGPPPGAGPGGPGGGPGGPGRGGGTADSRMQNRDRRLDRSTAEQRAMRSAYMNDMQIRRMQLGLPTTPQRPR